MADRPANTVVCWCNKCRSDTLHDIVAEHATEIPGMVLHGEMLDRLAHYMVVAWRGCSEVHFLIVRIGPEDIIWAMGYEHPFDCPLLQSNFPPRNIARIQPDWIEQLEPDLRDTMEQTYSALHIGADRLVCMGARAAIEHVAIEKCGDKGSFPKNIQALADDGFLQKGLVDTVLVALDVGSASIHRGYKPDLEAISDVFSIVEGVIHGIHVLPSAAERLKKSTPPRKKPLEKPNK